MTAAIVVLAMLTVVLAAHGWAQYRALTEARGDLASAQTALRDNGRTSTDASTELADMRYELANAREELAHHRKAHADVEATAARMLAQRDTARDEVKALQAAKPVNVRDLVPELCDADPTAATAGRVRLAFRAHVLFFNEAPAVLHFRELLTGSMPDEARLKMLCELYQRAVFECLFCQHFDKADPRTDMQVLRQVTESLGSATALQVHDTVKARGVVIREPDGSDTTASGILPPVST